MTKQKTKPRKLATKDGGIDPDYIRAVYMAERGASTKYIMRETGFSPCQVTYRLSASSTKRMDYRNGLTPVAKQLMEMDPKSEELLRRKLKAALKSYER